MMINFERILKECFWEYNFTQDELIDFAQKSGTKEQKFLFEKILLNSTHILQDLRIFCKDDLRILIENYKIPSFNYDHIFKRKNMAEVYFLDKPLCIDELQWIA